MKYNLIGLFLLMMVPALQAHQQKETYTTILVNSRTQHLEVSHRFYLHDAEHALFKVLGKKGDIYRDPSIQQEFASYVQKRFQLKLEGKKEPLKLIEVGHEAEGKFFWVYQEFPFKGSLKQLQVQMSSLQEIWPKQVNHINVEQNGKTRSVRLKRQDGWQPIQFVKSHSHSH